jgi:hypothetical protein
MPQLIDFRESVRRSPTNKQGAWRLKTAATMHTRMKLSPLLLEPEEQLGIHSARGSDGVLGGGIHHGFGDGGPTG